MKTLKPPTINATRKVPEPDSLWTHDVPGRPDLTRLKTLLCKRDGNKFQRNDFLADEIDRSMASRLSAKGEFFDGNGAAFYKMATSQCHTNSLLLALLANSEAWKGLALSEDGVWRVHSWCVGRAMKFSLTCPEHNPAGRIIETTEPRTLYFGVRRRIPACFVEDVALGFFRLIRLGALNGLWSEVEKCEAHDEQPTHQKCSTN